MDDNPNAVRVAVIIRPLVTPEELSHCISVTPGEPQNPLPTRLSTGVLIGGGLGQLAPSAANTSFGVMVRGLPPRSLNCLFGLTAVPCSPNTSLSAICRCVLRTDEGPDSPHELVKGLRNLIVQFLDKIMIVDSIHMEPYVYSCCTNCYVVKKQALTIENNGRTYYSCPRLEPKYGCGYFIWEDELLPCPYGHGLCIALKDQIGVSYKCPMDDKKRCGFVYFVSTKDLKDRSSHTSNARNFVPKKAAEASSSSSPSTPGNGSSGHKASCSSCKVLKLKIKVLEAKLSLASPHEDHSQFPSLQELCVGLDEILDDEP
ncbi:DNA-binding protein HEXBP-like protein [Tanacetum coccineum]|uniref:DNA-binding protein HEXBP-like protein n=1 Tax=Tanacetum coccineum TaxID=301880 RepID=A0ABQ5G6K9_9ASTR